MWLNLMICKGMTWQGLVFIIGILLPRWFDLKWVSGRAWSLDVFGEHVLNRLRHCGGDRWNALWRHCLFLRGGKDGCDSKWTSLQPRTSKKCTGLHWYRENLKRLAELRRQKDPSGRSSQRNSRLARWIQQGEELRQKFDVPLQQPDLLESLGKLVPWFWKWLCICWCRCCALIFLYLLWFLFIGLERLKLNILEFGLTIYMYLSATHADTCRYYFATICNEMRSHHYHTPVAGGIMWDYVDNCSHMCTDFWGL